MAKKAAGKEKKSAKPQEQVAAKEFTHKRGAADTRGDRPGYPAGAHLDAPSAGVKS